jgi:hypothetical protein
VAVFASTASLEAYANELFFDRAAMLPGHALSKSWWTKHEQDSTVKKFALALSLRNCPNMNEAARSFVDVKALIKLRNALTHYKAEWSNEADRQRRTSEHLQGRFTLSSFLPNDPLFPKGWASHGATKWAVESCLAFAEEFEKLAGLPAKYDRTNSAAQFDPGP